MFVRILEVLTMRPSGDLNNASAVVAETTKIVESVRLLCRGCTNANVLKQVPRIKRTVAFSFKSVQLLHLGYVIFRQLSA